MTRTVAFAFTMRFFWVCIFWAILLNSLLLWTRWFSSL